MNKNPEGRPAKSRFVVIEENMLGVVNPRQPHDAQILSGLMSKGAASHWMNGMYPLPVDGRGVRPATVKDFDAFRMSIKGYLSDPDHYDLAFTEPLVGAEDLLFAHVTDQIMDRNLARLKLNPDEVPVSRGGAGYAAAKFIGGLEVEAGMSAICILAALHGANPAGMKSVIEDMPPIAKYDAVPDSHETIAVHGMAKSLFTEAFLSSGGDARLLPQQDAVEVALASNGGQPSAESMYAAAKLMGRIESTNLRTYASIAMEAEQDGPVDHSELGFLLAQQALGSGISWADDHTGLGIKVPSVEFYFGSGGPSLGDVSASGLAVGARMPEPTMQA